MTVEPITDKDLYKATLAACLKAESGKHPQLAAQLRQFVDASPFARCSACWMRVLRDGEPPCPVCAGDGFVHRVLPKKRAAARPHTKGRFDSRAELCAQVWRRVAQGVSRTQIAQAVRVSETTVDRIIDTGEGKPRAMSADTDSTVTPLCHFKPMKRITDESGASVIGFVCQVCEHRRFLDEPFQIEWAQQKI